MTPPPSNGFERSSNKLSVPGGNWWTEALRQGPTFVVLLLILIYLARFGDYVVNTGIPAWIAQIQSGYKEQQEAFNQNVDRLIEEDRRAREEILRAIRDGK